MTAFFGEGESHLTYSETTRRIAVSGIYRDPQDAQVSGRKMILWLKSRAGKKPIDAIDVAPTNEAMGFWEKMEEEGLIRSWKEVLPGRDY